MARRASRVNQLEKLERLYRKGVLTTAEYERERHKILYGDRDGHNERTIIIANAPTTAAPTPPKKKQGCFGAFCRKTRPTNRGLRQHFLYVFRSLSCRKTIPTKRK